MNIKRSYFKLLMASAGVGLFLANCTVKNASDDTGEGCEKGDKDSGCDCPGGLTGYQVCDSDGVFGSCVCPDDNSGTAGKSGNTGGTSNAGGEPNMSTAGKTYTAGAGGEAPVDPAAGGAGGEGGAPTFDFDPDDCESCLQVLCATELSACLADDTNVPSCFDQYQAIIGCIDDQRVSGLVKRDIVRACGVNIGSGPVASLNDAWQPAGLTDEATNLLNCMATSSSEEPNADWANADENYPLDANNMLAPTPWPEDSCAKLSCTGKF